MIFQKNDIRKRLIQKSDFSKSLFCVHRNYFRSTFRQIMVNGVNKAALSAIKERRAVLLGWLWIDFMQFRQDPAINPLYFPGRKKWQYNKAIQQSNSTGVFKACIQEHWR